MEIILKNIVLHYFKGIRSLELKFKDGENTLEGINGSGKTTIHDAFLWVIVDKDSTGRKDFGIKTLDLNNTPVKDVEHWVELELLVDGEELVLKKIHKEKWIRKRGQVTDEFIGNETTYLWNNVPIKKEQYNSQIYDLISTEETLRLLTDIKYFTNLTWQEKRSMLIGLVDEEKIQPTDPILIKKLKGKTTDGLKLEIAATKKRLLQKIDQAPIRIDEINNSIDETADDVDITELETIDQQLKDIDDSLQSYSKKREGAIKKRKELYNTKQTLEDKISERKNEIKTLVGKDISKVRDDLSRLESEERQKNTEIQRLQKAMGQLINDLSFNETKLINLRQEYSEIDDKQFPDDETKCPTCNKPFDAKKKKELVDKFNENKSNKLDAINTRGVSIKTLVTDMKAEIKTLEDDIKFVQKEFDTIVENLKQTRKKVETSRDDANKKYLELIEKDPSLKKLALEWETIQVQLDKEEEQNTNEDLINKKNKLLNEKSEFNSLVEGKKRNEEYQKRIDEIEGQRILDLDELSEQERIEYLLSEFIVKRINSIESQLTTRFNGVEFKMFEKQINGNINPTCLILFKGVPYADLNTASKINVSLNIINVFSNTLDVKLPIFVDNRESVTVIPEMDTQIINLKVNPSFKKLTLN
ncbi:MAG: hypothetical protein H7X88_01705 [Gloeobacteraceae cyanobacterium ES-bin-316]|nr:hypothetical protein [Ferruginibacter sp.]